MSKIKFFLSIALLLLPYAFAGCSGSSEPTVIEGSPMTAEEEAEYEEESYGNASDEDQN